MLDDLTEKQKEQLNVTAAIAAIVVAIFTVGTELWSWISNYHDALSTAGLPFPAPTLILITSIIFPSYLAIKLLERMLYQGENHD